MNTNELLRRYDNPQVYAPLLELAAKVISQLCLMSVSLRELSPGPVPLCRLFPVKLELVTEATSGCSGGSGTEVGSAPGGGLSEQDTGGQAPGLGWGKGKREKKKGRGKREKRTLVSGLAKEELPSRPLGPPLDLASQSGSTCAFNSLGREGSNTF